MLHAWLAERTGDADAPAFPSRRRSKLSRAVIALWLGHESVETTQMYLDADVSTKERALARTAPLRAGPGRFRAGDELLAFVNGL